VIWWVVGGIVALALIVAVVVALRVLGGLRELAHVQRALQRRVTDARALEAAVAGLQARVEELQAPMATARERTMVIQARRGRDVV
jgi:Tfp pilus assembly protein PilX